MTQRIPSFIVLAVTVVSALFLVGCSPSESRYYLGAFEQNQELKELFRLYDKSKDQESRFVLITQIASALANEGKVDREILFLTTHVEKNPLSDIYNGYYLLLVADAYRDMKAIPFAIHYYRRVLSNYVDLLVQGKSIHRQCLEELLNLETDPEHKIEYYKELISRFNEQSGSIYYFMARSYEEAGEWEQAMQAYRKFTVSRDTKIPGEPNALRNAQEKVDLYNTPGRGWMKPDLDTLVAAVKDAIAGRNMTKLLQCQAAVDFFQEPWDQSTVSQDIVDYKIANYLKSSNVTIADQPDIAANGNEATLRTTGWDFRPPTWYLVFRRVDFPEDPDINGMWEWAGIYFGEKL
jgi:tetratricopeptide (TPR) repeat protein